MLLSKYLSIGPLAGPVVAAACIVNSDVVIDGVMDSKATTALERDKVYDLLTTHPGVHWAASVAEHTEIDEVNILQATLNAMRRATIEVLKDLNVSQQVGKKSKTSFADYIALIDGNKIPVSMPVESQYVIKVSVGTGRDAFHHSSMI